MIVSSWLGREVKSPRGDLVTSRNVDDKFIVQRERIVTDMRAETGLTS